MGWTWKESHLDLFLVPLGLFIMLIYHLNLVYKYLRIPETTAIGFENHNKSAWVQKILQIEATDRGIALSVLNTHLSAATSLSSISLALCSLIGAILGGSSTNFFSRNFILGDKSRSTSSIKYISVLSCFLLAFTCFIQTIRHFVHANFLISIPNGEVPIRHIQKAVIRGSNFWAIGLRALYFAGVLVLWIFGPIPMFVSSVVAVIILHFVDTNKDEMIQYQSGRKGKNGNFLKKIEHNITSMVEDFDRDGRSIREMNGSVSSLEISDSRYNEFGGRDESRDIVLDESIF